MPDELLASSTMIKAPPSSSVPQEMQPGSRANDLQTTSNVDIAPPTHNTPTGQEAPLRKRPRTRAAPVSRFKTFDDGFDMDAVASYEPPEESVESQTHPSLEPATPMSMEEESSQINENNGLTRKRARSLADDAMVDGLLPATAAMKRRRLEIDQANREKGVGGIRSVDDEHVTQKVRKVQPKKEIDVRKVARQHREVEEETAKRNEEGLDTNLGEISIEEMKSLAVVVEMEVPVRNGRGVRANGDASDRWDERWNGRKNFKRFRRRGEDAGPARRQTQNVIVPLVEVRKKNYGIGESYWSSNRDEGNDTEDKSGRSGRVSSQTPRQIQSESHPSAEESASPTMTRLQEEAAEIVDGIDVERPRQTRLSDKTQQSQQMMNSSRGKRPATSAVTGPTAKKQRTIRTRAASESESDEELRFKFGARKK